MVIPMLTRLSLAAWLALAHLSVLHANAAAAFQFDRRTGNFSLLVGDQALLTSSTDISFRCGGKTLSSARGTLQLLNSSRQNGSDALGSYERFASEWSARENLHFTTAGRTASEPNFGLF